MALSPDPPSIAELTPNSFIKQLPGGSDIHMRAARRRELLVVPRVEQGLEVEEDSFESPGDADLFDEHVAAVRAAFCGHDPLDIALALVALSNLVGDSDGSSIGSLPASELGWTLLACGLSAGPARQPDPFAAVRDVYDRLRAAAFMSRPRSASGEMMRQPRSSHHDFFGFARMVRIARFDDQEVETLLALWGDDGAQECARLLGVDIETCLALVQALTRIAVARAATLGSGWPKAGDGARMTFAPEDVAAEADLEPGPAGRMLTVLTTPTGSLALPDLHSDTDAVRHAPLLGYRGRLFCCSIENLLRALAPTLEDRLADEPIAVREHWQRRRSSWLERTSVDVLASFLRPDLAMTNVHHPDGEIDGLLAFDDTVVLIEAKAGTVRTRRALNDPGRFESDVRRLALAPIGELRKARRALLAGRTLRDSEGRELHFPAGTGKRVIAVIVTLEHLAPLASQLWHLQRDGLLSAREQLPWMLSLAHLQTICELLEYPAQLVHFLSRRVGIDTRVFGCDEIDFVMAYLRWGLDLSQALKPGVGTVILPSGNDEVNEWIFYKRGWNAERVPRPQLELALPVQVETRARVRELDEQRPIGWVSSSLQALDRGLAGSPRSAGRQRAAFVR